MARSQIIRTLPRNPEHMVEPCGGAGEPRLHALAVPRSLAEPEARAVIVLILVCVDEFRRQGGLWLRRCLLAA